MKVNKYSIFSIQTIIKPAAVIIAVLFLSAAAFSGKAQTIKPDRIHIGLFYPVSTHGTQAPADTNVFSFNVFGGVSASEQAFTLGGLYNIIHHDARGVQITGLYNRVGNGSEGALIAGLINTYRQGKGVQIAGLGNVAREHVEGSQLAGLLNRAGDIKGLQFGGLSNLAHNIEGGQFAGLSNVAGDMKGIQFSGFLNKAASINGSQFAGFINIAKKVRGIQFSGLINIADSSDCPVGLINIIKNGEKSFNISTDDNLTSLISFRSGGKILYGILAAGYNFKNSKEVYAFEAGLGAHFFSSDLFRINAELSSLMLESFKTGEYFKYSFRLLPAVKLSRQVELFAGPVFNFVNTNTDEGRALTPHYISHWTTNKHDIFQGLYIGYMGGLSFLF